MANPTVNGRFHIVVIILTGLLIYSNTLHVPFQWDEGMNIVDNPVIKDFGYFAEPSKAKGLGLLYYSLRDRYIGYLSFALNYKINGLDVTGYHIVNISLHLSNSVFVYFLIIALFKTPFLSRSSLKDVSAAIALFASLLFVSHPIQTEAVTYIMLRHGILMSFFYLSAILLYMKWRGAQPPFYKRAVVFYLLSLLSTVLAMKTKENAFTLPFMVLLFEFSFFPAKEGGERLKRRLIYLVPFLLTLLIIPLTLMDYGGTFGGAVESATRHYKTEVPRIPYFLTQFRVVATYIRLLFLPVNQNFDYDYLLSTSFFEMRVVLSFLFLLSILGVAMYMFRRSKTDDPSLRLYSVGIFWFFIALSVESSIFPIPMIICEYRAYLPSAGLFVAFSAAAAYAILRLKRDKFNPIFFAAIFLIIPVLGVTAYLRNNLWKDEITLWTDTSTKSPLNARPHFNLGVAYMAREDYLSAIKYFKKTLEILPDDKEAKDYLGSAYVNLGNRYSDEGQPDAAEEMYRLAIVQLEPISSGSNELLDAAYTNLGNKYSDSGDLEKAEEMFQAAIGRNPALPAAYYNLGVIYERKGDIPNAIAQYEKALSLDPEYAYPRERLSIIRPSR